MTAQPTDPDVLSDGYVAGLLADESFWSSTTLPIRAFAVTRP